MFITKLVEFIKLYVACNLTLLDIQLTNQEAHITYV